MIKGLIIFIISILAIIDFIAIIHPSVKKYLNKREKQKRQKAFSQRMKKLEIK